MADAVIVPCESTRIDAMKCTGCPNTRCILLSRARITFAPCGDEDARRARLRHLGRDVPYVLFVGKLSQRRNIPALIAAFAGEAPSLSLPHALLLLGPNHTNLPLDQLVREHSVAGSVIQLDGDFADHNEIVPISGRSGSVCSSIAL